MAVVKVPGETEGAVREPNHENPVDGNHQAPSHWEPQWRNSQILEGREGWEQNG